MLATAKFVIVFAMAIQWQNFAVASMDWTNFRHDSHFHLNFSAIISPLFCECFVTVLPLQYHRFTVLIRNQ